MMMTARDLIEVMGPHTLANLIVDIRESGRGGIELLQIEELASRALVDNVGQEEAIELVDGLQNGISFFKR